VRDVDLDGGSVEIPPAGIVQCVTGIPVVVECDKAKSLGPSSFLVVYELQQREGEKGHE
jgi:hypothetical protein